MSADALAPSVARASIAMMLTLHDHQRAFVFQRLQLPELQNDKDKSQQAVVTQSCMQHTGPDPSKLGPLYCASRESCTGNFIPSLTAAWLTINKGTVWHQGEITRNLLSQDPDNTTTLPAESYNPYAVYSKTQCNQGYDKESRKHRYIAGRMLEVVGSIS